MDQSEGLPEPGIVERAFVKNVHRLSFAPHPKPLTYFFSRCLCAAPQLTKRLEQAILKLDIVHVQL